MSSATKQNIVPRPFDLDGWGVDWKGPGAHTLYSIV